MSSRPEILFLVHRIPYPPDKGDKIRSWRLLKHLTARFDVHLACFIDDPADLAHTDDLRRLCRSAAFIPLRPRAARLKSARGLFSGKPLSMAYYYNEKMQRAVRAVRARPLAAEIAFSSTMAQYLEPAVEGRPSIVDFCDADSEKWRAYGQTASGPMAWIYAREAARLKAAETAIANRFDASFAVTPQEAALFNGRPEMRVHVDWWANGVDTDYFSPMAPLREPAKNVDVAFTGAMDYRANVEAAHDFLDKVWPRIRAAAPHAQFAIVGARPVKSLRARHGKNGVIVTGRVDDIRPWLQGAKIAVAPLRVARGMQNKVLEAMAMAKPVVATTAAATGIEARLGEELLVADAPDATARLILSLLNDDRARARMGLAARAAMLERYAWDRQLARFDAALSAMIGDYSSSPSSSPSSSSAPSARSSSSR